MNKLERRARSKRSIHSENFSISGTQATDATHAPAATLLIGVCANTSGPNR
ncbi:hypothetical protein D3C78_1889780 [compost metagenome]